MIDTTARRVFIFESSSDDSKFWDDPNGKHAIVPWDEWEQTECDAKHGPIYCPTCHSCGEDGCCPPETCDAFVCLYGEGYVKSYKELLEDCDFYLHLLKKHNIDVP